jgi:lysophospholipase L1-like esterase
MFKKVIWPIVLISSLVLVIVFVSGFVSSIYISKSEEKDQTEKPMQDRQDLSDKEGKPAGNSSEILILGDSIGFGIGDEENLGLEKRYLSIVNEEAGNKKESTNISVPGYTSNDLANLIKSGENNASISDASLLIISIGGNDLNRLEYEDAVTLTIAYEEALTNYKTNLELIIKEIRTISPDAQLAFIGLYNPYSKDEPEKARFLLEWNYETRLILDSDAKFAYIPTYELFDYHLEDYLSLDEFHPSGAGYQVIAEELDRILN